MLKGNVKAFTLLTFSTFSASYFFCIPVKKKVNLCFNVEFKKIGILNCCFCFKLLELNIFTHMHEGKLNADKSD